MSYTFHMMTLKEIQKRLLARKKEWTSLAEQAAISRKTIERIANNTVDPRNSTMMKLSALLA